MVGDRPAIPRPIERAVKMEAGYRCAIPACRATSALQIAHIVPYAQTQDDSFENLIYLCSTDHWRYDKTGEIDRKAIRAYKANLAVVNARYNDFEQRLLQRFHADGVDSVVRLGYVPGFEILMQNLVTDGMVTVTPVNTHTSFTDGMGSTFIMAGGTMPGMQRQDGSDDVALTEAGKEFVQRWFAAESVA